MSWVSEVFSFIGSSVSSSNFSSKSSERYFNCAISMTTLQYSCEYIYVPYLGGGGLEDTAFLIFFPFQGIHYLLTLQSLGLYLIRQRLIVLASLAEVPAMNKGISKVDSLRAFSESTKRRFASVLAVASSYVIAEVSLYVGEFRGI